MIAEFIWDAASKIALTLQVLSFDKLASIAFILKSLYLYSPASNTRSYNNEMAILETLRQTKLLGLT